MDVLLLLLQEVITRVCFAFQSLLEDHCRAIDPMEMSEKPENFFLLAWSAHGFGL